MFLKRSVTNSTSVINANQNKCAPTPSSSSSSKSVQNLVSLVRNHSRYSFLTGPASTSASPVGASLTSASINDITDLNTKRDREKFNVLKVKSFLMFEDSLMWLLTLINFFIDFFQFFDLKEVISSEKKYLNDLKEICDGYYDEIAKFKSDHPEFIYHIFSNIKDIYEFTK